MCRYWIEHTSHAMSIDFQVCFGGQKSWGNQISACWELGGSFTGYQRDYFVCLTAAADHLTKLGCHLPLQCQFQCFDPHTRIRAVYELFTLQCTMDTPVHTRDHNNVFQQVLESAVPKRFPRHVRGECPESDKDCCGEAQQHRSVSPTTRQTGTQWHRQIHPPSYKHLSSHFLRRQTPMAIHRDMEPAHLFALHSLRPGLQEVQPWITPSQGKMLAISTHVRLRFHLTVLKSPFNPTEQLSCRLLSHTHLPSWCMTSSTTVRAFLVSVSICPIPANVAASIACCNLTRQLISTACTNSSTSGKQHHANSTCLDALPPQQRNHDLLVHDLCAPSRPREVSGIPEFPNVLTLRHRRPMQMRLSSLVFLPTMHLA